jgi:hypothetical protein
VAQTSGDQRWQAPVLATHVEIVRGRADACA